MYFEIRPESDEPNIVSEFRLLIPVNSNRVQLFWEGHKNLRNLPHGFDVY